MSNRNVLLSLSLSLNIALLIFIFSLFLSVILIRTNPTQADFKNYIKKEIKINAENEDFVTRTFLKLFAAPSAWIFNLDVERTDYSLFSTYHIRIEGRDCTWIGINGDFYLFEN